MYLFGSSLIPPPHSFSAILLWFLAWAASWCVFQKWRYSGHYSSVHLYEVFSCCIGIGLDIGFWCFYVRSTWGSLTCLTSYIVAWDFSKVWSLNVNLQGMMLWWWWDISDYTTWIIGNLCYQIWTMLGRLRSILTLGLCLEFFSCGSAGNELSQSFVFLFSFIFVFYISDRFCTWWVMGHQVTKRRNKFAGFRRDFCPTALANAFRHSMRFQEDYGWLQFPDTSLRHYCTDFSFQHYCTEFPLLINLINSDLVACHPAFCKKTFFLRQIEFEISRVAISAVKPRDGW